MSYDDFHAIHIRPWLTAGRTLLPRRSFVDSTRTERTMNLLGLQITRAPHPAAHGRLTTGVLAVGTTAAVVLSGGVAYAVWSSSGTGTGAAKAGTSSALTALSAAASSATGGTLLVPSTNGATTPTVPLVVNIHNPNTFAVKVSTVTVPSSVSPSANSGGTGTCSTTGVTLFAGTYSVTSGTATIAAGADAQLVTSTNAIGMATTSDDGCQGATFTFAVGGVTVTG